MQTLDITIPLLIYGPRYELLWTNPDMLDIVDFSSESEDGEISPYSSTPVHRIQLSDKNNKHILCVIAKSPTLEKFWEEAFKDLDEDAISQKLKEDAGKTKAVVETLMFELETLLLEDFWITGGEQFCFTPVGRKIGRLFSRVRNVQFSPDCALSKDDDGGYDFET